MDNETLIPSDVETSNTGLRFWITSESGQLFSLSRSTIDLHFSAKAEKLRRSCRKHGKLLVEMGRLSVYREKNMIPKTIMKVAKSNFPRSSQETERLNAATHLLNIKYQDSERRCFESESKHRIGECDSPEKACLKFMNNYFFTENAPPRWFEYEDLRDTFRAEHREHILDYFLDKFVEFRETKYDVYIERMMGHVHRAMWETKWALEKEVRVQGKRLSVRCCVS